MSKLKIANLSKKHVKHTTWPREAKLQAVSQYLVLGNMALVSSITGIDHQLLRSWKCQPWWKEMENEVRLTENIEMDTKLTKIVDKSLEAVLDRVENGEFIYDQKTGQIKRKPASLRDIGKVSIDLLTKRELLRGNATERKETTQVSVAEQLKQLATEFAKWQQPNAKKDTIDVEMVEVIEQETEDALYEERETGLQEGTELGAQEQAESGEGQSGEEFSSFDDGESGESDEGGREAS